MSGEIGTGRFGLCNTVPEAMAAGRGALVWGHGVFTAGRVDFRDAFAEMVAIERCCREEYARRLGLPPARTFRRAPAGGT